MQRDHAHECFRPYCSLALSGLVKYLLKYLGIYTIAFTKAGVGNYVVGSHVTVRIEPICQRPFSSHPPTTPHDKIGSREHNNLFLRYNLEAPKKRNNREANFGFSETKEKHTGWRCPAPGSQGGPRFVSPGYLLRSPEVWGNNRMSEGKMGTESDP